MKAPRSKLHFIQQFIIVPMISDHACAVLLRKVTLMICLWSAFPTDLHLCMWYADCPYRQSITITEYIEYFECFISKHPSLKLTQFINAWVKSKITFTIAKFEARQGRQAVDHVFFFLPSFCSKLFYTLYMLENNLHILPYRNYSLPNILRKPPTLQHTDSFPYLSNALIRPPFW